MITSVRVENFKCFLDESFSVRPLTVLTGVNGGGKSSLLQALLLVRAAARTPVDRERNVALNGPYGLSLGFARDILNWQAPESVVRVTLRSADGDDDSANVFLVPSDADAVHLAVEQLAPDAVAGPVHTFTYLCAERLGPRDVLALSPDVEDVGVGVQGEFTAHVLALHETRAVAAEGVRSTLRHPDTASPLLRLQTEAWMSSIVCPIRISAQLAGDVLGSTVRFEQANGNGPIRPTNMGFGVSYALPIVVAGLLTRPGDVFMVENPEAHLHPAGQSTLGRFLGRIAGSGVQVIVETHSDHVLNGARLAVAEDKTVAAADMVVHYFDRDQVLEIGVSEVGDLGHWPDGFFDQMESDLGRLARARRGR